MTTSTTRHSTTAAFDQSLVVTVDEAAALLRIGRTRLYALINEGNIDTVQIGRCRRIRRIELERYVSSLVATSRHPLIQPEMYEESD